jgi:hypothetical protein
MFQKCLNTQNISLLFLFCTTPCVYNCGRFRGSFQNSSSSLYSNSRKKNSAVQAFALPAGPQKCAFLMGKHTQRKKKKRREKKKSLREGPRALHGHGKHSPLVVITWDRKAVQSYGNFFFFFFLVGL